MDQSRWIEIEFNALRQEILTFGEAERSAVKFYVPAAAAVYAIPYFLLQQSPQRALDQEYQTFLWTFCAAVAGLLTLALLHTLYWSINAARKIGAYIKECIEPRTEGGLRWESVFFRLSQKRYHWPSDAAAVGAAAILANVVVASAASIMFLTGSNRLSPPLAAAVFAAMSLPTIRRIVGAPGSRAEYVKRIADIRALLDKEFQTSPPTALDTEPEAG
jgi:hypothetical protein